MNGKAVLFRQTEDAVFAFEPADAVLRDRLIIRPAEAYGVVFENRSGAYIWYVSTGSAENCVR